MWRRRGETPWPGVRLLKPSTSRNARASSAGMSSGTPRSYHFEFSAGLPSGGGGRGATPARVARVPRRHVGRRPRLSFSWDILPPLPGSIYGTSCCVAAPRVSATLRPATVLAASDGACSLVGRADVDCDDNIYIRFVYACVHMCVLLCVWLHMCEAYAFVSAYQKSVRPNHRLSARAFAADNELAVDNSRFRTGKVTWEMLSHVVASAMQMSSPSPPP